MKSSFILLVFLYHLVLVSSSWNSLRTGFSSRLDSLQSNENRPCVPIKGKTALVIGQDLYSMINYTLAFDSIHNHPFGLMSYTALKNDHGYLTGMTDPIDYGSGTEWTDGIINRFPLSAVQLGLWLVGQLEDIVEGSLQPILIKLIHYFELHPNTPFYLRIGYEFDTIENQYDPILYKQAFQQIVTTIRSYNNHSIHNVAFVWHASGFPPRDDLSLIDWFPGIEYVDWCGISLFQQPFACSSNAMFCTMDYTQIIINFCHDLPTTTTNNNNNNLNHHDSLPIMIAESTPFGGIIESETAGSSGSEETRNNLENEAGFTGNTWDHWFIPIWQFIERNDIRMWSYINCDWDSFPMWQRRHAPGIAWGDSRIQGNNNIYCYYYLIIFNISFIYRIS
jgi:hypothetical protein